MSYVAMLLDPTICNTLFASFICQKVVEGHSVLTADDRVMCEDPAHVNLQVVSYVLIAVIACGVPIGSAAFLLRAHLTRPAIDVSLQQRVATDFSIDLNSAKDLIGDIQFGSSYAFLVAAFRPGSPMYLWESIDSEFG